MRLGKLKELAVRIPIVRDLWLKKQLSRMTSFSGDKDLCEDSTGKKLNVACGRMHLSGFVNIDIDPKCEPDLVLETENLHSAFPRDSVQQIVIIHGLNYLSFNDAKRFFRDALELLKVGGTLIIENPCAEKFSPGLASGDPEVFAESAFALLAVNENGYTHATSYKFVWSSEALERELMRAGFSAVTTENPKFHGGRAERDARFIASR